MSSRTVEPRALLEGLFLDTIRSLDPGPLVADYLREHPVDSELSVVALGKAALPMARAALESLGDKVREHLVIAPEGSGEPLPNTIFSTHPRPSESSVRAAREALALAGRARGLLLVLISGGGSALAALPAKGLSLEEKAAFVQSVYDAGATIDELNSVRKHLSDFKGGALARASSAPVLTLALSDVVGDSLSSIASGPSVPDPTSYADALEVVQRYGCAREGAALEQLRAGALAEARGVTRVERSGDRAVVLAGLEGMMVQAADLARGRGVEPRLLGAELVGEVSELAEELLVRCDGPGLWIGAGESTISLCSDPGCGGRAQQLALLLARGLDGRRGVHALVAGSDGIDGASSAAGAVVSGETWQELWARGLNPAAALEGCDAGTVLEEVGATIRTGPTGVNHADLVLLHIDEGA